MRSPNSLSRRGVKGPASEYPNGVKIKPVPGSESCWEVRNRQGDKVYLLETCGPECHVREYDCHYSYGRGAWLVTYLGSGALDKASEWVRKKVARSSH